MCQSFRVLTGLQKGLGLVLGTHVTQLTNTCNSNLKRFNTLVSVGTCTTYGAYKLTQAHKHTNKYVVVLGLESRTLFMLSETKTTEQQLPVPSFHVRNHK